MYGIKEKGFEDPQQHLGPAAPLYNHPRRCVDKQMTSVHVIRFKLKNIEFVTE